VGAILRSAAAFGVDTAVLGPGCADPWSPKVLRAAMGGHFALRIAEAPDLDAALAAFPGTLLCAVPPADEPPASSSSGRLGWILGAEGQGVEPAAGRARGPARHHSARPGDGIAQRGGRRGDPALRARASAQYTWRSILSSLRMVVAISSIDLAVELIQRMPSRRIRLSACSTS
jgi:hypothetical protein